MDKKKTIIIAILALIGLGLTVELAVIFFKVNFNADYAASFCSVSNLIDCDGVAKTRYAMVFGIPLALWGMLLYLLMLFLNFVHIIQDKFKNTIFDVFKNPKSYIATFGVISFILSVSLASISIFTIKKICVLCFVTYFINLFIAIVAKSKGSFFIKDIKNTVVDFIAGVKQYTVLFIVVLLAFIGVLAFMETSMVLSPQMKMQKSFDEFRKMKKNPYAVSGNVLGNPNGEIKVQIYSDFMCPFCKVTDIMISKLAKEEKDASVVHFNFPLDNSCNKYVKNTMHPGACVLARYAIAAGKQGKYWDMVDLLFETQPKSEREIIETAAKRGITVGKLIDDVISKETNDELLRQIDAAISKGIFGTPTIVIDDIPYISAMPYYKIKTLYKQAKNRHKQGK